MTITRGIAAAAMFAGLAVGTASTAWAETTMSGHYIVTNSWPGGTVTEDWYFTSCGDGCASVNVKGGTFQAHVVNGQWTMDSRSNSQCLAGQVIPNNENAHYTWDPNTLTGTVTSTNIAPVCGVPAGVSQTNPLQLKQAP
jgi:hypothetical protein